MSPFKKVNAVEQLERMADAVKDNPEVTVAELRQILGFAQERSVYYWLAKTPYKGIKEFRRAVLTGKYNPGYPYPGEHISKTAEGMPRSIPLATGFSEGFVVIEGEKVPIFCEYSGHAFAYRLKGQEYYPVFVAGDLLIIDPNEEPRGGDFVLTIKDDEPFIFCYYSGEQTLLAHPTNPTLTAPEGVEIIGPIMQLIRSFD